MLLRRVRLLLLCREVKEYRYGGKPKTSGMMNEMEAAGVY